MAAISWAFLPPELLELIFSHLSFVDVCRCKTVCVSWFFSATAAHLKLLPTFPPLLLIHGANRSPSEILDFSSQNRHPMCLRETWQRWLCCSSGGWLLSTDHWRRCSDVQLFNPFSKSVVVLPSPKNLLRPELEPKIERFAFSSSPADPNCVILVTFSHLLGQGCLAFCHPADDRWTRVYFPPEFPFSDVVFYKGQFYLVDAKGNVFIFKLQLGSSDPDVIHIADPPDFHFDEKYLVESSSGDFMLVLATPAKRDFEVFRLDLGNGAWDRVTSLGDEALFLGHRSESVSVSLAGSTGPCKGNCIYYLGSPWSNYVDALDFGSNNPSWLKFFDHPIFWIAPKVKEKDTRFSI
ncbi:F-box/kelch-repeat protein At1g57790-like [Malania oleifera]|uniref:F-box/kelch-repeat protein At1g57790-like n=1 Tax=Malania oleifera TaxID=397392 RepID=UPI0025AE9BA9|nr:F-box/kelch-repeat protein At1g57790-like [Malania oleifera]